MKNGFSLIEMTMVLLILSVLLSSLLPFLSKQKEAAYRRQTKEELTAIKEALLGYTVTYGHLPCPATSSSSGKESRTSDKKTCMDRHGFVPAGTLGLFGNYNAQNLLIDPWGNPYHYSVSEVKRNSLSITPAYCHTDTEISTDEAIVLVNHDLIKKYRLECIESKFIVKNITSAIQIEKLPVVIFSVGKNINQLNMTADEKSNVDKNGTFATAETNTFDDIIVWISPHILYHRMIAAGVY